MRPEATSRCMVLLKRCTMHNGQCPHTNYAANYKYVWTTTPGRGLAALDAANCVLARLLRKERWVGDLWPNGQFWLRKKEKKRERKENTETYWYWCVASKHTYSYSYAVTSSAKSWPSQQSRIDWTRLPNSSMHKTLPEIQVYAYYYVCVLILYTCIPVRVLTSKITTPL